jgi:hypothetical protein
MTDSFKDEIELHAEENGLSYHDAILDLVAKENMMSKDRVIAVGFSTHKAMSHLIYNTWSDFRSFSLAFNNLILAKYVKPARYNRTISQSSMRSLYMNAKRAKIKFSHTL